MDQETAFSRSEPFWTENLKPPSIAVSGRDELTITEVAGAFGISPRSLRFYEEKGLLAPIRAGSLRHYGKRECDRLALLLKAKALGFTLSEIRQMLEPPPEPTGTFALNISRRQCHEQIKLLEQRKREVEAALAELRRMYSSFYVCIVAAERDIAIGSNNPSTRA